MQQTGEKKAARMSDAAVQAKTGTTWAEWFAILDAAGADRLDHKGIVAYLHSQHRIGDWWQQMVAVTYEQARGRRELHQKPGGYEISASKTVNVPVAHLFAAWQEDGERRRWLGEAPIAIRTVAPNRSIRLTWVDGQSWAEARFYAKGESKSQVAVQHGKLPDAAAADGMKAHWGEKLERLKALLEAEAGG